MREVSVVKCTPRDFSAIYRIINESSIAYKNVIPRDCWKEPYMSQDELRAEIDDGVEFWRCESGRATLGVIGIQDVKDVTLVRHAYVLPSRQREGVGTVLLAHLRKLAGGRALLVGTWKDATWAVRFYEKNGFRLEQSRAESYRLLKKYWKVPRRQMLESVVLVSE